MIKINEPEEIILCDECSEEIKENEVFQIYHEKCFDLVGNNDFNDGCTTIYNEIVQYIKTSMISDDVNMNKLLLYLQRKYPVEQTN